MDWSKLTLVEQLGNIASEITRARVWEEKKQIELRNKALERAIALLDQTIGVCRDHRAKEFARLREMISQVYLGTGVFVVKIRDLENFLLPFAIAARRGK